MNMDSQYYDARRLLVVGIALVALYGLEQERLTLARMGVDWAYNEDEPSLLEVRRVMRELKTGGGVVHTPDTQILDRLAHARQTAKISLEEWKVVIRVEKTSHSCLIRSHQ